MEWWDKVMFPLRRAMRRVWSGVAIRLGIRNAELLKLRDAVQTCESEDVHVMWEMLQRMDTGVAQSPIKKPKRAFLKVFMWARSAPRLCRTF